MSSPNQSRDVAMLLSHRDHHNNPTCDVDYQINRGLSNLYSMTTLPYGQNDIVQRQGDILGPLSLFAPYAHEANFIDDAIDLVRPFTSVEEEVRAPITSFQQLATYVLRRLPAGPNVPFLDMEDQEELAAVLMGELNGIWTELQKQPDDPFFTKRQNLELKRQMAIKIVKICERLFGQYVKKAQILNRRGVFTGPANVSRLKAQLGLEANKELNIPSIRRWVTRFLHEEHRDEMESTYDDDKLRDKLMTSSPRRRPLLKPEVPSVRTAPRRRGPRTLTVDEQILDMKKHMPNLRTERLISVLEEMDSLKSKQDALRSDEVVKNAADVAIKSVSKGATRKKRSMSLDETHRNENLADELELDIKSILHRSDSTHLINIPSVVRIPINANAERKTEVVQKNVVRDDLNNLIRKKDESEIHSELSDDMPPLIQAITRNARHDGNRKRLDEQLKQLELKEKDYIGRMHVRPLEKPRYPQPSTISTRLPNRMSVRASDVRVSERVCLSSFTVEKKAPLFNDLSGEVDIETVKHLDRNLFRGDELKEVYQEIMKTVPTDYLEISNDPLVVKSADSVSLGSILLPSALKRRKSQKIVNKTLQKSNVPPWGTEDVMTWAKTPVTQLSEVKIEKSAFSQHNIDAEIDVANIPGKVLTMEEYKEQLADCPRPVQERLTRNYHTWLTWWQSTMSSEDYFKFLASQETDYLGYMYHYYDSDDDEEGQSMQNLSNAKNKEHAASVSQCADVKRRQEKIEELRLKKTEFTPGFWNPCSVLMGGLGKDPVIEDEEIPTPQTFAQEVSQPYYVNLGRALRLKGDNCQLSSESQTELSKVILEKQNAMLAEAQRLAAEKLPSGPSAQERLEKVWSALQMPDQMKLDMALKYSSDQYINKLDGAISSWEQITDIILKRERLLAKLENFERLASDPNRFFEKGFRGSAVARLDEAKQRSHYYAKLDDLGAVIASQLARLENDYRDTITFQSRPYVEKMHCDRIEMLYWLQEERKENVLQRESLAKGLPLGIARLDSSLQIAKC